MPFHLQGDSSHGQSSTFCATLHAGHGAGLGPHQDASARRKGDLG